jgi:hypothetical protein
MGGRITQKYKRTDGKDIKFRKRHKYILSSFLDTSTAGTHKIPKTTFFAFLMKVLRAWSASLVKVGLECRFLHMLE